MSYLTDDKLVIVGVAGMIGSATARKRAAKCFRPGCETLLRI